MDATNALRLGAIAACCAFAGITYAPGSSDDQQTTAPPPDTTVAVAPPTTPPAPSTTPPTSAPSTSAPSTTNAPPTTRAPAPAVPVVPGPRSFAVLAIVGVGVDRGESWIALATVSVIDQTGSPAAGVDVHATFSHGGFATSCVTDPSGTCSMYQSAIPATVQSTTLTLAAPLAGAKAITRTSLS